MDTGTLAQSSDLINWYNVFNTFISSYGGGISTLTVPTAGKTITTGDINALYGKVYEFAADAYLSAIPSYWQATAVTAGDFIQASQLVPLETTMANMANIKCRNIAAYSYGANSNGYYSNGICSSGSKSCGTKTSSSKSNGKYASGTCSNGTKVYSAKSCGSNTNGSTIQLLCAQSIIYR